MEMKKSISINGLSGFWIISGERKDVRDNISSNLGSFSWSGDISPYYERNIKCFEQLLDHQKQEVREWAQNVLITKRSCLTWRKMKRILGR